jgi:hypothetical protein
MLAASIECLVTRGQRRCPIRSDVSDMPHCVNQSSNGPAVVAALSDAVRHVTDIGSDRHLSMMSMGTARRPQDFNSSHAALLLNKTLYTVYDTTAATARS